MMTTEKMTNRWLVASPRWFSRRQMRAGFRTTTRLIAATVATVVIVVTIGSSALAAVVQTKVSSATELQYSADVSASDLLHGITVNASGWQTLNGSSAPEMNDGIHGGSWADEGNSVAGTWSQEGATAEYNLGTGGNGLGYDITNIQTIAAWKDAGFGNQAYKVEVKPVGGSYVELATVLYTPFVSSAGGASKVTLTDGSGVLACGIEFIRFTANSTGGQSAGNDFVFREIDVFGVESVVNVTLDGSTSADSIASNAAPGTLVGALSMVNTNAAGFSYTLVPSGDHTYFDIPAGTTNLLTAAWIDASSYGISIVGTKGAFSVTNGFTISVTPGAADFLAFEVAAEMSPAPVAGTEQVGVLKSRDTHASGVGFSITGGRDDLFVISGGTNLMQVAGTDPGAVGTINYVEVTATNAVATNTLLIAVEVVSGTPQGIIFTLR